MSVDINPRLKDLIRNFGAEIGIADLALDEDGFCSLTFDGKVTANLQLAQGGDTLVLFADLGPASAELYESLLRANFFWQATQGATLSVTGDEPRAVIAVQLSWGVMTATALGERVRRFVDAAEDWADYVNGGGEFAGAAADADGEMSAFVKV